MAKTAGHIAQLVLVARKSSSVRIAARASDAMTADAELLTGTSMTTGAGDGVEPRLDSVLPPPARGCEKSWRMRAAGRGSGSNGGSRVAIDAKVLRVAGRAESRL